jgi:competence ComEA-like helix-hairpin-helix protein
MIAPALAHAALIDINTADAALLDTLPGIGPAYATRIVDYRSAHGPFARIEDIQNVSGIGPSTFADIKSLITVGSPSQPAGQPEPSASSSPPSAGGAASTYVPPPASIALELSGESTAYLDVPLILSAHVTAKGRGIDASAQVAWSFGDGSSLYGTIVEKTYRYPGTYLVTATAVDGEAQAHADLTVIAKQARVRMLPVTTEGVTLSNESSERLDLSRWRILSATGSFRFPEGTVLLPRSSVLFPFTITNLPFEPDIALLYPDGIVAARPTQAAASTTESAQQPSPAPTSYKEVQTARSGTASAKPGKKITSATTNSTKNDIGTIAPTAAAQTAAVGAAPAAKKASMGIFKSPWTLSLLGVIAVAGGAFILL